MNFYTDDTPGLKISPVLPLQKAIGALHLSGEIYEHCHCAALPPQDVQLHGDSHRTGD